METCLYKGKQICAYDVTNINYALNYELKKEWRIAGRNGELICQECGKEVQLRVNDPRKKTPHFSHKVTDDKCPFSNNDLRESEEHKKGKMLLYQYFKDKYPGVVPMINYRFPNKRKCDIYIEFNNGDKLAIEYQRTELDILEWQERQEEYKKIGTNVLWLLNGKEDNLQEKIRQIEVSFFQQIMLNELDKIAAYLDVDKLRIIFAKNMRYSDPYIDGNDFEELYVKSYNLNDVLIHTNGKIECDFIDEYKKVNKEFEARYSCICLNEEKKRQGEKKRKVELFEVLHIESRLSKNNDKDTIKIEKGEKEIRYFTAYAPYKNKIKYILKGSVSDMEETVEYLKNNGNDDDFSVVTTIFQYNYLIGNKKANEMYSKLMDLTGQVNCDLVVKDYNLNKLVCPICKGKLLQRYGGYGAKITCINYPHCRFVFNIDLK